MVTVSQPADLNETLCQTFYISQTLANPGEQTFIIARPPVHQTEEARTRGDTR